MIKRRINNRKKRNYRWLWWWLPLLIAGIYGILLLMADTPPVGKLESTRTVLSEARKMDAGIYSRHFFREAEVLYDSAMLVWKRENEKWIITRDFTPVVSLAEKAEIAAKKSIEQVRTVKRNLKEDISREIALLRQEMDAFEKTFAVLPLDKEVKSKHSRGKLLLNEAEIAFEKGDYNQGREKSHEAAELIRASYSNAHALLDGYFSRLSVWQGQLADAISRSARERDYVIVVEKIPARCDLYYKGVKKYSFPAEFGRNWIGDKRLEGDYATPEGNYKVVKKLSGRQTKYYKALLVNYPNPEDLANFAKLKKSGQIASHVRPGGLIEIHGDGGRGVNWTNGCVALSNKDMDELYRYTGKDTPILIIGASEPWTETLKTR